MTWPFEPLRPLSYSLIMADPPWRYELWSDAGAGKSAESHYETMPDDEICALPVDQLARGDCVLWLWATGPKLEVAFRVLRAWGFTYCTFGAWEKVTHNGRRRWGTGYVMRSVCEPFLIGTIGSPVIRGRSIPNLLTGLARGHSRKPEEAFAVAEGLVPDAFRLELFSRRSRLGWDTWGKERTKFDEERAA